MTHPAKVTERDFTDALIEYAQRTGWKVFHARPAMDRRGRWKTAVQGDGVGFPDLVLIRRSQLIFAELKSQNGKLSDQQVAWMADLALASHEGMGFQVEIWRPSDWPQIEEALK